MKLNSLFGIFLLSLSFFSAVAQKEYIIELKTDDFPYESSWEIRRGGKTIFKKENLNIPNHLYSDTLSLDSNYCHTFLIFDKNNNGICCQNGDGYYRVYENGSLILEGNEFQTSEYLFLNCPSGTNCETPYPIEPGKILLEDNPDSWYLFIPDSTGLYQFSTCQNNSNCETKIWGYNGCYPELAGDDRPGTIFYGEQECAPHREISALLEKDESYYIRIGREDITCTDSIWWELSFLGQISGCIDPLACNYNPLATQDDGSCIFNGDPDCPEGPDLSIDERRLKTSLIRHEIFNSDPCLNAEGCLKGYGTRTVIRFATWIDNKGKKDFYVGHPPEDIFEPNNTWEFDACHNHWHYEGYAEYLLFDTAGIKIPVGVKNGFCIMDVGCNDNKSKVYHCNFQGISSNCYDIYERHLACQWIDITDVRAWPVHSSNSNQHSKASRCFGTI
ncbi:MAG: lysyl oxidase family protein [Saprospiraceae bacterium]